HKGEDHTDSAARLNLYAIGAPPRFIISLVSTHHSVADDFNEQDYATLVSLPSSFWKFPEAFMCLVGLSYHYILDEETYLRFLHKNKEGGPLLLETTIGHTILLLPVAPDRAESELNASVEKLCDKGGSGNQTEQEDFTSGGKDAVLQPVIEAVNTVVEDVAPVQPKRQGKRKFVVVDAGHDATYAMTWETLKKKMTNKYYPKGKIKKLEIELWNLRVKGNDVAAYTQRFQELALICTKFLANETKKVDKYISRLPDNIHGNVMSARPKTLDETIELANDLMDQKLCTYAKRLMRHQETINNNPTRSKM
nr:reverse transcriptase domain-containing protein [Tanacetum cinerariifolium]